MSDTDRMTPKAILDEIRKLPLDQQMDVVEEVCRAIAAEGGSVPAWQLEEILGRLEDPAEVATETWADLRARLSRARG
jgi:hypothetical protein